MSLIIARNFKRAKAQDAADKTEKIARDSAIVALFQPLADAQAELRDGNKKSNAKNVLAAAIAAAEKEFKGNPFSSRDKRIIDDAKKVLAQFDSAELNNDADSRAADANFKKGDKVTVKTKWAGTRKGIVKEVINDPALKKAYVVEIEGAETYAYPAEIVSADACDTDAKFKERDDVFVKMPDGHEEEGTIVKVYTDHYDVKLWDSGVRAVGFSKVRAMTAADASDAEEDNYYLTAKKSIEDAGRLLASAVISLSRSKAPNAEVVHAELTRMSDMFERIRKRI